ncbi:YteA family regulatory protein [Anaerosolibacter carboniphilus]|uniref:YteA family regulatory protein n=1 Tax=Anaerosolibacter carboniphilus TaxID=1417629 RepID=A0A841L3K8_9FIRM|nr:TraR/DksA C4-type zinc finger protein [Anaerosolibacter carboniphilus]MBB6216969.1 YteA family regulatory protein [Anaerosolibacter carboniphilus]
MNKQRMEYFKDLLLQEREVAQITLERMNENEPNDNFKDYFDELSVYDNHPADIGTELFQVEMNFNLKNNEELHLQEIDNALHKIEDGSYGSCITCGKDIAEERLEILPTAVQCMDCEKDGLSIHTEVDTRPVEEEVLYPPFGRSFKDYDDSYNGFDGEDAWQAVERYNEIRQDPSFNGGDQQGYFDDDEPGFIEEEPGIVEEVEQISEDYYVGQLENEERKDIPYKQRRKK